MTEQEIKEHNQAIHSLNDKLEAWRASYQRLAYQCLELQRENDILKGRKENGV